VFNQPDVTPFRDKLRTAGFYAEWKGKYGDHAWDVLEKAVGKLVVVVCGAANGSCRSHRDRSGRRFSVTELRLESDRQSPRPRSLVASIEAWLGFLVEIPAAVLVVAEIVILFAGVIARYVLHQPLIWFGRTGLDAVPLAGDAGGGGGVPPLRTPCG